MIDIIFPNKNEKEFIQIAERLDTKGLVLVYNKKEDIPDFKKLKTEIELYTGLLSDYKKIESAKKYANLIMVKSSDKDRQVLEKSNADLLFGLEETQRKDFIHHKASGLNQVLCNIASKRKKLIGFPFASLLNSNSYRRAQILGRMTQNISLCRKYKVNTAIASFATDPYEMRTAKDLEALFTLLGMHPKEAREALNSVGEMIKRKF